LTLFRALQCVPWFVVFCLFGWRDSVARRLLFIAPSGRPWRATKAGEEADLIVKDNEAVRDVPAGTHLACEFQFA
jgi:hypothetical protein